MPEPIERQLNLSNVAKGAAPELFDAALADVLKNIDDPNFKAEATRKIVLEIGFRPDEDRHTIITTCTAKTKLAERQPGRGLAFMGRIDGELAAATQDVKQEGLFDQAEDEEPGEPDITPDRVKEASDA